MYTALPPHSFGKNSPEETPVSRGSAISERHIDRTSVPCTDRPELSRIDRAIVHDSHPASCIPIGERIGLVMSPLGAY